MKPHRLLLILATGMAALALAGAWPASAQPASPPVARVALEGLVHVEENAVRRALTLKPGDRVDPARLETERKALLGMGYFRSVAAAQSLSDGLAVVTFRVVEWPRVTYVRVVGNTVAERGELMDLISTQVGQVLCAPQLRDDIRAIEEYYRERGYVARVSDQLLEEATRSGILRFEIQEFRIDDVQVEGGSPELRERARRLLVELPPALYRPEAVSVDQRRLLRMRGVRTATAEVVPAGPGKVRIRWALNAPPAGQE